MTSETFTQIDILLHYCTKVFGKNVKFTTKLKLNTATVKNIAKYFSIPFQSYFYPSTKWSFFSHDEEIKY